MISFDDQVPVFSSCPRCGERGLDVLSSHAYCVNCNYSPDLDQPYEPSVPQWVLEAISMDAIKAPELEHHLTDAPLSLVRCSNG